MQSMFVIGTIGDGTMAPQGFTPKGEVFRRLQIFVDDPFGEIMKDKETGEELKGRNGQPLHRRQVWQVIFDNGETGPGAKIFPRLNPGMKILVRGRMSTRPRPALVAAGREAHSQTARCTCGKVYEAYANPTIHAERCDIISEPMVTQGERICQSLKDIGKIDEAQMKDFVAAIGAAYAAEKPKVEGEPGPDDTGTPAADGSGF